MTDGHAWLDKAGRTLTTSAAIADDDPESGLILCYDAGRHIGTGLLAQQGLRATTDGWSRRSGPVGRGAIQRPVHGAGSTTPATQRPSIPVVPGRPHRPGRGSGRGHDGAGLPRRGDSAAARTRPVHLALPAGPLELTDEKTRYGFAIPPELVRTVLRDGITDWVNSIFLFHPVPGVAGRRVQRVPLHLLQVPCPGADQLRRRLVLRAARRHRGHRAGRVAGAETLPAPEGRPVPLNAR